MCLRNYNFQHNTMFTRFLNADMAIINNTCKTGQFYIVIIGLQMTVMTAYA